MRVAVIVNPVSGRHRGGERLLPDRLAAIARVARAAGVDVSALVTTHPGHATELARSAVASGATVVVAWGGDGTVNEVANGLAFSQVALGIVPAGSGNGLGRELRLSPVPERALAAALSGPVRPMDLGEVNGRLFVNVAGIGFDACVARAFNRDRTGGWGLPRYVRLALDEARRYEPQRYHASVGGTALDVRAMVIAIANSAQYGNGAKIAPLARVDDGVLDMVVVEAAEVWRLICRSRRLFDGSIGLARGVRTLQMTDATITSDEPMAIHVDGEPMAPVADARIRVHRGALLVVAPA